VGAAAIYVSVFDQIPKSIGVARDLDRALDQLQRVIGLPVTFGWIAWSQPYEALLAIAKIPDLMLRTRDDGVKVPKSLPEIVQSIAGIAERSRIVLTPHKTVIERATALSLTVEQVFVELRANGQLAAFNSAYKIYRASAQANGEKVLPYWAAQEQLRKVTIKALATSPSRSLSQQKFGELISQQFPWFRSVLLDNARKRA
jgi:aromatic ring-opening dioxygenase LigB subunit